MKKIVKDALILTLITLIAGCALGVVHEITKKPISAARKAAIDEAYEKAMGAGAIGGKLLGAGGGGFLLFYVPLDKQDAVKEAIGLPQMPMAFDRQGSAVIYVGDKPDFI